MSTGAVTLLALSIMARESWQMPVLIKTRAAVLYLTIIGSVILFYLFLFVVRRWTASATSYQFVLLPFVTVVVAAWLAGETVRLEFILGGALFNRRMDWGCCPACNKNHVDGLMIILRSLTRNSVETPF
jgi:drug/metabolite transporter (DMT)-like permease